MGRMAAAPNPCIHLEAMEETEDQVEKPCEARRAGILRTYEIDGNRSIIPRYRKVVVSSTHTAENHDFISSDQGSKSSTSKSLFRSARSGNMLSR